MIRKNSGRKLIAALLAVTVATVYSMVALAAPGSRTLSGELTVTGQATVNGQKVISGGTVFSDSSIATAENSSAIVSIGRLGRIELLPNTNVKLSFSENSIVGLLDGGQTHVSTAAGVVVNLSTKDGSIVVDGSQATSFTVNTRGGNTFVTTEAGKAELRSGGTVKQIAAGDSGSAGLPNAQAKKEDFPKLSGGALAALLLAAGGAVAAIIYAATHNNDLNFNGTVNVISPTK